MQNYVMTNPNNSQECIQSIYPGYVIFAELTQILEISPGQENCWQIPKF